jgi:urea transport system ATP-binding protein
MGILLVEQYFDFAQELADFYVVMQRGEVVDSGDAQRMRATDVRSLVAI